MSLLCNDPLYAVSPEYEGCAFDATYLATGQ